MVMDIWIIFLISCIICKTARCQNCVTCKFEKCEHPGVCLAGYVKDVCDCCWICGQKEGEDCNFNGLNLLYEKKYPSCGDHLNCELDKNLNRGEGKSAKCVCKYNDLICATDGQTYTNLCHMLEESNRKFITIKVLYKRPCDSAQEIKECGPCDQERCPRPSECLAGIIKDQCGCCFVCARKEGELCDNLKLDLPYKSKYGVCGENLECKSRKDLASTDRPASVCVCKYKDVICGTDSNSYSNLCKLMEEAYRTRTKIKIEHRGPCKASKKPMHEIVPCGTCQPEKCATPENCLAGIVKDSCGCCMICGRKEGELCESDHLTLPYKNKYGHCGENLECKIRTDIPSKGPVEAICFCKFKEVLCSTENKIFSNMCKLMEESYRSKSKIKVQHRGPCRAVPWIASPPDDRTNKTGDNVAFSCEVMGFPVPIVDWRFGTDDSNIYMLPGDEQRIAVQSRGGPEQYEVTSWLQIQGLTQKDDGMYTCIAKNEMGEVRASARLVVLPHKKRKSRKGSGKAEL